MLATEIVLNEICLTLNVPQHSDIFSCDEIDSNTLPAKSTTTTNTVNIIFAVGGKIVIDDQRYLLDVNPARKKVSGDQYTR